MAYGCHEIAGPILRGCDGEIFKSQCVWRKVRKVPRIQVGEVGVNFRAHVLKGVVRDPVAQV